MALIRFALGEGDGGREVLAALGVCPLYPTAAPEGSELEGGFVKGVKKISWWCSLWPMGQLSGLFGGMRRNFHDPDSGPAPAVRTAGGGAKTPPMIVELGQNRHDSRCAKCGEWVPAFQGFLFKDKSTSRWFVTHREEPCA